MCEDQHWTATRHHRHSHVASTAVLDPEAPAPGYQARMAAEELLLAVTAYAAALAYAEAAYRKAA